MPYQASTDHEWIIHSLNIHGSFFQRKCVDLINTLPIKSLQQKIKVVETEYPVGFPPNSIADSKNKESRLDILARITNPVYPKGAINLVIECKKNNPDFTNWIFFEKYPEYSQWQDFVGSFLSENYESLYTVQTVQLGDPICSEGREVKENYGQLHQREKTKTSNASIEDACYQVVIGTHSLIDEQFISNTLPSERGRYQRFVLYLYIPIIVTTANLYLCDYSVSDVREDTGEIEFEKTELKRVNSLWYEYPIPPQLQLFDKDWRVNEKNSGRDIYHRRYIYIVNSLNFQNILIYLIKSAENLLDLS